MKEKNLELATFAGGCFWCMQPIFEEIEGVKETLVGYTGGETKNPSYEEVSTGRTGHFEAIKTKYDPKEVSYNELLETYWKNIDPTDEGGQFSDRGQQYKTAIFYHNQKQKKLAKKSKKELNQSNKFENPIKTQIIPSKEFYIAEEHHQHYYKKKTNQYKRYKEASGRKDFIEKKWSGDEKVFEKKDKEELRDELSELEYEVTQEEGTEPAFDNEYWDNKEDGIYVDIVSGEPLFSSNDKFESGTGWPSFTKPLDEDEIIKEKEEDGRIEVIAKKSGSHLGHVFDDGPNPTGKRYCMNSAALDFIPKEKLEKEGYGEYKELSE